MCGITGLINLQGDAISPVILKQMTDAIAHRGPDGEGQWIEGPIGLGHRRLSIIDLSDAGKQPMVSADSRYIMSYNGELYNYKELQAELRTLGYHFHSKTDSEVILYAYAAWGIKALQKFNGMFAFAIWDRQAKTLCLARDRYGIKPVYYALQNGHFFFGSEQKAIRANPSFRSTIDKEALLEYFTFQNILTDKTLVQDLKILPAGHVMIVDPEKTNPIRMTQYWDFNFREPTEKASDDEYREELDRLFKQADNVSL